MRLGICMIVKNEEACLKQCLESVKGLGEIYILDTGSTDKTCEIARKYTDKVFENEYKWNDNFAEARNYILDKCDADWVLSIDADEYLRDGQSIHWFVKKLVKDADELNYKSVDVVLQAERTGNTHMFPRLFKRSACRWKGAVHNHLNVSEQHYSELTIVYGYSETHKKDPDRAFRILTKEVQNPERVRELYYLAREYVYRRDFKTAIEWYTKYLRKATWAPEIADAKFMIAKCHKRLNNTNESIKYAMAAIAVNNDYKEAIEFVADMVGPKNSERWLYFAYCTKNQDVLFVRENYEANADYYNNIYSTDDPSRYKGLYERVAELSAKIENPYTKLSEMNEPMTICDIGCGSAELSKYVKNYEGFDFSEKAIEFAKTKTPNVKVINLYEYDYSRRKIYTVLEVLEHIDDLKLLDLISSGNFVIASVPSFADRGHLRRYTERIIKERFKDLIDIKFFERFNWNNGVWIRGGKPTNSHITLFGGIKK